MSEIKQLIKQLVRGEIKVQTFPCTVKEVEGDVCTCTPLNGDPDLFDVRLRASMDDGKGIVVIPKKGSVVLVSLIQNNENVAYVSAFDEVDKIEIDSDEVVFNQGDLGGLTKTQELKSQLDKNNQVLSALLSILTGPPIPEPGNGSPSALQAALKSALAGKTIGTFENIENKKIKH